MTKLTRDIPKNPEQEPVAWLYEREHSITNVHLEQVEGAISRGWVEIPLYTTQPQRKRLTHEQRLDVMEKFAPHQNKWAAISIMIDLVEDAIEAAHGIKGEA